MINAQEVRAAYRLLLGRDPESQSLIENYVTHATLDQLRNNIMGSAEFAQVLYRNNTGRNASFGILGHLLDSRIAARQMEHLASLQLDLRGKSVMNIVSNATLNGSFFIDRQCKVVTVAANDHNLDVAQALLCNNLSDIQAQNLLFKEMNFSQPLEIAPDEQCQIVFCYNMLWRAGDIRTYLQNLTAAASEILLLETCATFGIHDDLFIVHDQSNASADHAARAVPTRAWLWNRLEEAFPFVYATRTQPRHSDYPISWIGKMPRSALGRLVLIGSHAPLGSEELIAALPAEHALAP